MIDLVLEAHGDQPVGLFDPLLAVEITVAHPHPWGWSICGRPGRYAGARIRTGCRRAVLEAAGGYRYPASQTPWQEIQRSMVGQLGAGMVSEPAVKYQQIAQISGIPRDNH
ncbi:MAG: hypothetical protein WCC64_12225 [Aliidongia sp.]